MTDRPGVGVGVVVRRSDDILLVRRLHHGRGSWSTPGGYLGRGESFAACAEREVREETGLRLTDVRVVGVTNDIHPDGKHNVTIWLAGEAEGEATLAAPEEIDRVAWFDRRRLPANLYGSTRNFVDGRSDPPDAARALGLISPPVPA
ncbi:MAG TPA: NUDIX domain-containing protein [Thermomicrobiales bacterium]|nr:NUDIX domain-containing protein [Thermomicrobiales bacterium]